MIKFNDMSQPKFIMKLSLLGAGMADGAAAAQVGWIETAEIQIGRGLDWLRRPAP